MSSADYRWRDRHGVYHTLDSMGTSYVFNAWIMLWDTLVPECHLSRKATVWAFSEQHYPTEYLMVSENAMYRELCNRVPKGGGWMWMKLDEARAYKKERMWMSSNKGDRHINWLSGLRCWYAFNGHGLKTIKRWDALQVSLQLAT